jgi:hypothetical protein
MPADVLGHAIADADVWINPYHHALLSLLGLIGDANAHAPALARGKANGCRRDLELIF